MSPSSCDTSPAMSGRQALSPAEGCGGCAACGGVVAAAEGPGGLDLLGALGDGYLALDGSGAICAANPEAARLLGRSADDLIGLELADVVELEALDGERRTDAGLLEGVLRGGPTAGPRRARFAVRGGVDFVASFVVADPGEDADQHAVLLFRDITDRWQAERVYRALHRVGRAVASDEDVLDLVSAECAEIFRCDSFICRFDGDGAVVLAASVEHRSGDTLPVLADGPLWRVRATGQPARIDDYSTLPEESPLRRRARVRGYTGTAATGIEVGGRMWGAVVVTTTRPEGIRPSTEHRLAHFAELIGLGIANREARAELEALAAVDPLTGFGNHRTFQERLRGEMARAGRAGSPLSLALLDIDRFKDINDENGHQVGDEVLRRVSSVLRGVTRASDILCRTGGDELAWILPGASSRDAVAAVERARKAVAGASMDGVGRVTLSAGVCDLATAGSQDDLQRFADGALYHAKHHGRDRVVRYSPDVVGVLSDTERADGLARQQALQSIRVLARAVDAKDTSTREHSERVADVAVQIAHVLGWDLPRAAELREAGLVHDVGKIAVPDSILFKPSRLSAEEFEIVKQHASVGAEMVADVLTDKQVSWVRGHHERWDGGGYPDGLGGEEIPTGARILALADSWDVMTAERAYSASRSPVDALAECRSCSGSQFWPEAVEALARLCEAGALIHHGTVVDLHDATPAEARGG